MRTRVWKIIISIFFIILSFFALIAAIAIKFGNQYRPSVYNYESYLSPKIIGQIKEKYNYKVFKEISEFTQALTQDKAIAGVGSDFQAAQLIIDQKIKKINFEKIYGPGTQDWEVRKHFYTKNVISHLEAFDAIILNTLIKLESENKLERYKYHIIRDEKTGEAVGYSTIANSKKSDHFYEYVLPYFIQDKGIAYNINEETRPNLDINKAVDEIGDKSQKLDWDEIFNSLRSANYKHFGWTNAFVDNLMIGAMTHGENWMDIFTKVVNSKRVFDFNDDNYRLAIDSFIKFVEKATGNSIKNAQYNYLSGDGLELLNHLIEPKAGRSDAVIMYNGDALDAYYSTDNFSNVEEGKIKFIRPKNNYLLMDNWILSKALTDKESDEVLETIGSLIYKQTPYTSSEDNSQNISTDISVLERSFFSELKEYLEDENLVKTEKDKLTKKLNELDIEAQKDLIKSFNESESLDLKSTLFSTNSNWEDIKNWNLQKFDEFIKDPELEKNYEWLLIIRNTFSDDSLGFSEAIADLFSETNIGDISNFDYVSYTPTSNATYNFILKWYFANDEEAIKIYEQPDSDTTYSLFPYPIIDNNLRTKISSYYFEATKS
ncbi:hypothetical protein HGG64_01615 [Mycoplasma phocoeninasale]|uniref:Spermidine/putrescine transport system substrate-binding protein n=1 Tax=Mycoplasma phocoeninasale TaxID=2726117 RepID=A0A858U018_9MOLU|nr:hypothetical protein [Mycoplasma phocoeninasale]QJG66404.1 hypothetical protein HGG64_01615 [Mycoplasma phocoeninasale]